MNPFEDSIRKKLSKCIHRGKIDVYIRVDSFGQTAAKIELNAGVATSYYSALRKLANDFQLPDTPTLAMMSSNPDIFMVDKSLTDDVRNAIWAVVETAIEDAISQFNNMRQKEGQALFEDILQKRDRIIQLLEEVNERLPDLAKDYEKRVRDRLDEVFSQLQEANLSPPDESRILTELALYAERICVDEEVTRLKSHLDQFDIIMSKDNLKEPVGRKLDFLVQELNREVNTIGSKNGDVTMSKLVIEMKSEIEKIREQVQNVE